METHGHPLFALKPPAMDVQDTSYDAMIVEAAEIATGRAGAMVPASANSTLAHFRNSEHPKRGRTLEKIFIRRKKVGDTHCLKFE